MFYYQVGDLSTDKLWNRPTLAAIEKWSKQWLNSYDLSPYTVTFFGCAAEQLFGHTTLKTWDVDIMLQGEVEDYFKLKEALTGATVIGWANGLSIDIFHIDFPFTSTTWQPYNQIRFYKSIYKKVGRIEFYHDLSYDSLETLPHSLYKLHKSSKSNSYIKFKSRLENGEYEDIRLDLKSLF